MQEHNFNLVQIDDKINVTLKQKVILEWVEPLQEKEKMLVTSIVSFSHNVFKRLLFQGHFTYYQTKF